MSRHWTYNQEVTVQLLVETAVHP